MTKQKQEYSLSFKVSAAMKAKIDQECETENRSQADMTKLLIAEALCFRDAKSNTRKIL
jgi:hypothetical protein